MPLLSAADFEDLRKADEVKRRLRLITPDHLGAVGRYVAFLPLWLLAAVYGGYALDRAGLSPGRWLLFTLLALAFIVPLWPVFRVRRHLRRPVLDALAARTGLDYASHDFELRAYKQAKPCLFGEGATETLTDLLASKEGGTAYAICHAEIEDEAGKPLFSGLIYSLVRRGNDGLSLVVLPVAGGSEEVKLPRTMKRVDFASDAAFEAAFQVWSNRPTDAPALLKDDLRLALFGLARDGPVWIYLDRDDALIAGGGPKSFEPEDAAARKPEQRVRAISDAAAAAFRTMNTLRARLG